VRTPKSTRPTTSPFRALLPDADDPDVARVRAIVEARLLGDIDALAGFVRDATARGPTSNPGPRGRKR